MNIKLVMVVFLSLFISVSSNLFAGEKGGGKHFVFNLIGPGSMYESTVPDIGGNFMDDPAICFDTELGFVLK